MILIIDHNDSFVMNLFQLIGILLGPNACPDTDLKVVRSDRKEEVFSLLGSKDITHIILSPGPGHPADADTFLSVIETCGGKVPILGVCLGHQAIGMAHGAEVIRLDPCHGKASSIMHVGYGLFRDVPQCCLIGRYHSLAIKRESCIKCDLKITAVTETGIVMAVQSLRYEHMYGVQFHPESILGAEVHKETVTGRNGQKEKRVDTRYENGNRLLANFLSLACTIAPDADCVVELNTS